MAQPTPPAAPEWLVSFMAQDGGIVCGGALVDVDEEAALGGSPTSCRLTILTARHCLHPTIPACAAVGKRLDGCSQPGTVKMQSYEGQTRVGERLSMPEGDLSLVRLRVPGSCESHRPLDTRACRHGGSLELWTWRDGVVHHRPDIPAAMPCLWAPAPALGSRPPVEACPEDWLLFEGHPVTDSECHKLDETARPRESGGVLVCQAVGGVAFAGILSQSCDGVGSFLRSWRSSLADNGDGAQVPINEVLSRAGRCSLGEGYCTGVGKGGFVKTLDDR
jgi:hypothetical protein